VARTDGDGFQQCSFVNAISTPKGGTHVNMVLDQLVDAILLTLELAVQADEAELRVLRVSVRVRHPLDRASGGVRIRGVVALWLPLSCHSPGRRHRRRGDDCGIAAAAETRRGRCDGRCAGGERRWGC